jgi:PAS domain S-box-containing protein
VIREATRELLTKVPVPIVLIGEPALIKWANPRAVEVLGMPLEQLEDQLVMDIVHPDDRHQAASRAGGLFSGEPLPRVRYRVVRPNGTEVAFDVVSETAEIDGATYIVSVLLVTP